MTRALALIAVVACVLSPSVARAAPEDLAAEISSEIMSPFCPGSTLHDCPSAAAVELRREIEDKARAGWTKARIVAWLEDEYGPAIHGAPPADDGGWLAWTLPALAVLVALATAIVFVARAQRSARNGPDPTRQERAALERELARLRRQA